MEYAEVFAWSAAVIAAIMLVTWLVSLPLRNASIVDPVWPLGFVAVAWVAFAVADGDPARSALIVALVSVWGVRLSGYLVWRNSGKGEDFRYAAMRRRHGDRFWLVSLGTVFLLQGVLMWVVSLPAQMGQVPDAPGPGLLALAGTLLWAFGLAFETVGDWQLARFKRDPASRGEVMDRGLWRYTRHPNYFGDFCVWWGIFLVAAEAGAGWASIAGPLLMSVLLIRVSGVALLEKDIAARRPGYAEYARRTSAFFPRPPRSAP